MTPTRPYLIRAIYDWIVDNGMTPHLLIDSQFEDVQVPRQYEQDGKIVLNISSTATQNLDINNEAVEFSARFEGEATVIYIPISHVLAIYTRENGQGMMFGEDNEFTPPPDSSSPSIKRTHLKVVK